MYEHVDSNELQSEAIVRDRVEHTHSQNSTLYTLGDLPVRAIDDFNHRSDVYHDNAATTYIVQHEAMPTAKKPHGHRIELVRRNLLYNFRRFDLPGISTNNRGRLERPALDFAATTGADRFSDPLGMNDKVEFHAR